MSIGLDHMESLLSTCQWSYDINGSVQFYVTAINTFVSIVKLVIVIVKRFISSPADLKKELQ